MYNFKAKIANKIVISKNYFLLGLDCYKIAAKSEPGNFVMIRVDEGFEIPIRKPFGIFTHSKNIIWILIQIVGDATHKLFNKQVGDSLDVLGPLGNSWPKEYAKSLLLIAGGCGIVPIFSFAASITSATSKNCTLLFGIKSKDDINICNEFDRLKIKGINIFSDDGSVGIKGTPLDNLDLFVSENNIKTIFACGPHKMLTRLHSILKNKKDLSIFLSLESYMGCGFGACNSCVIEMNDSSYKKVCKDGPIFKMADLKW